MLNQPIEISEEYLAKLIAKLKEHSLLKELCDSKLQKINSEFQSISKSYFLQKIDYRNFRFQVSGNRIFRLLVN